MSDTITITGNVATPPEFKRTPAGVAITTFRVASAQRRYDRATGAWTDAGTNWYTVSAFRGLADHAFHSLSKGDRVILTGRLRLREWDNGTRRGISVEIDAEALGHDLLWGTTTFEKDDRSARAERDSSWSPSAADDAWAAPGVESSADAATTVLPDGDGGEQRLVLVGGDAQAPERATDADAPF
ncbi:single-stranded DNA-binding protein [Microbacterium sp. CPCC 204701]|uniref:single-stranded DNA-binding protein n=1 Tax=Microbacterium sp. CPCC 204701 TaxID=2493084 RepID=UPI000FD7219B|nr:single-stranded DNA-binding protein [Microbacterium sp. CPCC 204701]